jgi:hypothetical protein
MARTVTVPDSVADLLTDPKRVRDAFQILNALVDLEVHLVPAGNVQALSPGNHPIRGDAPNLILPLPLMLPRAIADSSATAASASAQLNLLLAGLRTTRQLPS